MNARISSLWQRMSRVFLGGVTPADGNGGGEVRITGPEESVMGERDLSANSGGVPWWRRGSAQAQMREVAQRIVSLAESLQQHFERQDTHSAKLTSSLDHVGNVLEQLAETQRAQGESLRALVERGEAAGKHAANMADTLARIPESLLTQAEAIQTVAGQLQDSQESDNRLRESLQHFSQAIGKLSDSGGMQAEALQHLHQAQREQHDAITALVREQSRRFLVVVTAAAILTVAAVGTMAVTTMLGAGS